MRSIRYENLARRSIKRLDTPIQERVEEEIARILKDPFKGKSLKGNLKGKYRSQFGDYRILYEITNTEIIILLVSHRKDVYKIAARLLQLILSL